jgi:hypothetical protein
MAREAAGSDAVVFEPGRNGTPRPLPRSTPLVLQDPSRGLSAFLSQSPIHDVAANVHSIGTKPCLAMGMSRRVMLS